MIAVNKMEFSLKSLMVITYVILTAFWSADAVNQCEVHPYEINLLNSLLQETDHLDNVNFITGQNPDSPAIVMDGSHSINVDNTSLAFQRQLHNYSCSKMKFVIQASVKFDDMADGPIFFLHTNNKIFLSLEVEVDSTAGGNIKVSFVHNGEMRAISFAYAFTDLTSWHNIIVVFNGMMVSLYVNCEKVADQVVMRPDYCLPEDVMVTIGSNPQHTEIFKGYLQDLIISFKEDAMIQHCPKAHTDCSFSAEYLTLTDTVNEMMRNYEQEVNQLQEALNSYLSHRTYSCFIDGRQFEYGTFLQIDNSKICFCNLGGTEKCYTMTDMAGSDPIPSSSLMCTTDGRQYSVGDLHYAKSDDGATCTSRICEEYRIDVNTYVPSLRRLQDYVCDDALRDCSDAFKWTEEQRQAAQCCGFCTACEMENDCPEHAVCMENSRGGHSCICDTGFFPDDDGTCKDIDECANGHRDEIGHHTCPNDEACINTVGSYTCVCPEGYQLNDHNNRCEDIDECKYYPNACPADFNCKNTRGSYICECDDGYEGAGNHCIAQCNPPCSPEGRCIEPNVCACPSGLEGKQCEIDVDECQSGNHGCSSDATCINFHGGYFCRCNDGYHGNGRSCHDINECVDGTHTCPSGSTCQNTKGSYHCDCPAGDCKDGCVFRKEAYPNNSVRSRQSKKCTECTCNHGLWTCAELQCNCSLPDVASNPCCSHCQEESCYIDGHEFDHNQEFTYPSNPCKQCICKHGQEECTGMEPSFVCPMELAQTSNDGCRKCAVEECTLDNEGVMVDVNSSCSVCVCKGGQWTCNKKEVECPTPLCNSDQVITIGCCPVCIGTSMDPQAKVINSAVIGSNDTDDDDNPC